MKSKHSSLIIAGLKIGFNLVNAIHNQIGLGLAFKLPWQAQLRKDWRYELQLRHGNALPVPQGAGSCSWHEQGRRLVAVEPVQATFAGGADRQWLINSSNKFRLSLSALSIRPSAPEPSTKRDVVPDVPLVTLYPVEHCLNIPVGGLA